MMRKTLSLRAAVAMADFNVHLSPPAADTTLPSPPPSLSPANCDARKCPWWPYTSSKDFKANTALILIILFCALIFALAFNAAIRYIVRMHCSRRRDQTQENPKQDSATSALEADPEVPALVFSETTKLKGEETECIICLSEFAVGDRVRVLEKCGHGFHVLCVQKWLVSHSSCPTCRTDCSSKSDAATQL